MGESCYELTGEMYVVLFVDDHIYMAKAVFRYSS